MRYSDIKMFIHCKNCNNGQLAVGQTHTGVMLWCEKCDKEVYYIEKEITLNPKCECAECGNDFENKEDLK